MFCQNCGNEVLNEQNFCQKCGHTVSKGEISLNHPQSASHSWESKVIQIAPAYEDETIKEYESFGWELSNSQTIDKQDSHLENQFGTIYSVTETEKYVKLTFKRNKNIQNYKKITELETRYRDAEYSYPPKEVPMWKGLVGSFAILISFYLFSTSVVSGIVSFAIGALLVFFHSKAKKSYNQEYDLYLKIKNENTQIRYECLKEAENLLKMN